MNKIKACQTKPQVVIMDKDGEPSTAEQSVISLLDRHVPGSTEPTEDAKPAGLATEAKVKNTFTSQQPAGQERHFASLETSKHRVRTG